MEVTEISSHAKKLVITENGQEVARAFIYLIKNDLHEQPYALLEDVFVQEKFRGQGLGIKIINAAIEEARKAGCYKIIGTSRYERENVHKFYQKMGFKDYGKEFRMNLN